MFAFPFRLGPNGSPVTVDDSSDEGISQLIASVVLTRAGEHLLYPSYGIPDPVFDRVEPAQVSAVIAQYGPAVKLEDVRADFTDSATQKVQVIYSNGAASSA